MREPCDVCQAVDSFEPRIEVSVAGALVRWIYRCRACGFHQVRPRLSPSEILSLYTAGYFDTGSSVGYRDYAREAQRRRRDAYFVARWMPVHGRRRRALDVGCALGFLLDGLRAEGFDVRGVDASAFAAYYARTRFGIPVSCGSLEDAALDDASFDLVVQKDVLEHVGNPRAHLMETRRVMQQGAVLWLVTPNGEANLRPLVAVATSGGPAHLPLLDQGHLSFFSELNLRVLFAECGFEILRARAIGVRRGLRALGWLPGQLRFAPYVMRPEATIATASAPQLDGRDGPDESRHEALARSIDLAVARHRRRIRGWTPYYYLHRAWKAVDSLPAWTGLGYDFEFVLRRR